MSTRRDRAAHAIAARIWNGAEPGTSEEVEAYRIADMVLAEVDRVPDISELLEASSLGTPAAKAAIASVPDALAQRAIDVANRLRSSNGEPESDCACVCITHGTKQPCGCPCWRDHKTDDGAVRTGEAAPALATGARSPGPVVTPRRFLLDRTTDVSGVSGTGVVAEGCIWSDGAVSTRWTGDHPSTNAWNCIADILAVHGHQGSTALVWLDPEETDRVCRACGCTDDTACAGGCYWVAPDLCSQCGDGPVV